MSTLYKYRLLQKDMEEKRKQLEDESMKKPSIHIGKTGD
jgi:hypothetical protein